MADNIQLDPGSGGSVLAADDLSGVLHQRVKVEFGTDGNATDVSASNPMPVVQTGTPALPTGAATEASLASLDGKVAADVTADLDTGAGTEDVKLVGIGLPASGGAVVGGTSTNPLRTDPTGTTTQPVSDGGGSFTTDTPQLPGTLGQKAMAASLGVVIASDQSDLPISASALPLPTGAATAAKQPALGTAGTPSADVLTVQGHASGTALKVDGSAVTQPISAASLPLPSGAATAANQADEITALEAIQAALEGTLTVTGGGGGTEYTEDAAAAANPVGTALILVRDDSRAGSLTSGDGDNVAQRGNNKGEAYVKDTDAGASLASIDGKITAVNTGAVVVSSSVLPSGAATESTLSAASAKLPATLGQKAMAASMSVALASDQSSIPVAATNAGTFAVQAGQAAHDAAISGNPVRVGARAMSADFAAVATGDTVDALATLLGKLVNQPYALPGNTWSYAAPAGGLVNTTGVTAKAAAGSGIRNYVTSVQVINTHQTTSTEVEIRDGASGTVLWRGWAQAAGGGISVQFPTPLRGSANTLIQIAEVSTTATAGVLMNLQGYVAAE